MNRLLLLLSLTRFHWSLAAVVLVIAFDPSARAAAGKTGKPNILLIYADDQSARTLSCYEGAYPMAHTPNIDGLATSGVRFRAGYMGSWCMPSRATLLTGLHPFAIESMRMAGANPRSTYDPARAPFWPAVFRKHGYQTAQIGKWHTGSDAGWGRDWDFQRVWNRPGNPTDARNYYGPQVVEMNGKHEKIEGYSTDNYTRWAADYIRGEGRDPDKPWYLWLCYSAIHGPTIPAARHQGTLAARTAELPAGIFGPRPGKPAYLDTIQAWKPTPGGGAVAKDGNTTHTAWLQQAHECMAAIDEGVGQVVAALRESGQLENTLVIYTSDQGYANGEHGLKQKVAPYEATYASPFIVSMPGTVVAGKVSPHTVNGSDVVVTFFAQAGLPLPWKMPGRDFTPLLRDPMNAPWPRPTLYTHTGEEYGSDVTSTLAAGKIKTHAGVPYYAALRQGSLKYVRYFIADEPEELYDLATDPGELNNLAGDPQHGETLAGFRRQWVEELTLAGAGFLEHLKPLPATR